MSTQKLEYSRGETIAGKYEVTDLLGESPLGLRYRVKHVQSGKFLQLLLLDPAHAGLNDRDRIIGCFQRAREAKHPNLLKIGELGEADGVAYITTEDFDTPTLRDMLIEHNARGARFDVRRAAQIATGILEGLAVVHEQGGVLRALRPEHVLVRQDKDRGLAQVKIGGAFLWDLVDTTTLVEDEFTLGDAQYLAPELKSFEPEPTPRSDVYSAGAILYEMLVGVPPIGTFQLPKARRPDLPAHLNTVVELALAQAPGDRYTGTAPFIAGIQQTFQAGASETTRKPVLGPIAFVLGLVVVGLVAILAWALRSDPKKEAEALDSQIRAQVIEEHARPSEDEIRAVQGRHPQNMVFIPGGPFVSGRLNVEASNKAVSRGEPLAEVVELPGFLIDAFEAPNLKGGEPTVSISYSDAEAACTEQGKRLCTALEWEKACKGPRNTIYSWGDGFQEEACGDGLDATGKSGARPDCRSGWGVFDISGNFAEWTSSAPKGKDNRRLVKGGLKGNHAKGGRCAFSTDASVAYKDATVSYRCCRDLDAPPVEDEGAGDDAR